MPIKRLCFFMLPNPCISMQFHQPKSEIHWIPMQFHQTKSILAFKIIYFVSFHGNFHEFSMPAWWQLKYSWYFHPDLGKWSNLTYIYYIYIYSFFQIGLVQPPPRWDCEVETFPEVTSPEDLRSHPIGSRCEVCSMRGRTGDGSLCSKFVIIQHNSFLKCCR